ncbi:NADH-quinone oxidoreductase subunit L [Vulcanibacillus modesticaldus]|uniref:NADH-quinone oxidoreductase subunit L n=1 Tax=Vulcanibacillus modesticaldus TaxID=337097 RepID=A0A1D2YVS5_9BACI|nr:NADH-quinone oxidoreductase subunit L [Vulcanibacillus modesticaldus]OEF99820.1 NADH-quinone oxidoreductase subunit L [Vulcanibacillus modesticaldus]
MLENAWLVPLFPLISFVLLVAFGRQLKEGAAYVGIVSLLSSFIVALGILFERLGHDAENYIQNFNWLTIGDKTLTVGFEITPLNALMLFVVTLVSLMVHIYSKGYMHGDERFPVFYTYLSLFTFSMLSLVISPNLLQAFIFWELVGAASFLLIGFYYFKPSARSAAKKAFIVTRIGDLGLLIGISLLFWQVGTFEYAGVFEAVEQGLVEPGFITLTAILIFIGAIGKSGQFPLHTWLPDAMEGPTPVSALIHAATMVAAGVYLVARTFPLFEASETAMYVVATVGGFTAIFAASIGLVQNDIKRVLAYSTVSQLGYMMLALGSAGFIAGVFHLFTHAFFKALLFLTAGSVIHAVHTQNIKEMGGLGKEMKITRAVFLIGALAISGFPGLAGFFSKDLILMSVYESGHVTLFWMALIAAVMTAFYMFRLYFLVFSGKPRHNANVHESPKNMTIPMIILSLLAIFAGYIEFFGFGEWITNNGVIAEEVEGPKWIMYLSIIAAFGGIALAWLMYGRDNKVKTGEPRGLHKLLFNKYYIDELYSTVVVRPYTIFGYVLKFFDKYVIGGLVQLSVWFSKAIGKIGSRLQNGQVQAYGLITIIGLVLLLVSLTAGRLLG